MGILQPMHLVLILIIALIVVGPGKLSGLGGALGKSIKEFRTSMKDEEEAEPTSEAKTEVKEVKKSDA